MEIFNRKTHRHAQAGGATGSVGLAVCFFCTSPALSQTPVRITGTRFLPHCCGQGVLPSLPTQAFTCNSTALTEWETQPRRGRKLWALETGEKEGGREASRQGPREQFPTNHRRGGCISSARVSGYPLSSRNIM